MKGLYNYLFHVLLSRTSVHSCMWGFQKKIKFGKKVARSTLAAKKTRGFCSKHVLPTNRFQFIKKSSTFSSLFFQVFGNVLEEYVG